MFLFVVWRMAQRNYDPYPIPCNESATSTPPHPYVPAAATTASYSFASLPIDLSSGGCEIILMSFLDEAHDVNNAQRKIRARPFVCKLVFPPNIRNGFRQNLVLRIYTKIWLGDLSCTAHRNHVLYKSFITWKTFFSACSETAYCINSLKRKT